MIELSFRCKLLKMLPLRFLIIALGCFLNVLGVAQNTTTVYNKLVKRYGDVTAWGKGYIIKANSYYGFADAKGRIIIPVNNIRFDPLFADRASVCGPAGGLVNEYGTFVARLGYCVDRVVSQKQRLLVAEAREGNEVLCNDMGQWVSKEYDATLPEETMITSITPGWTNQLFGVITIGGNIILPAIYQSVSCGRQVCAGMRNDTAFVFNRNGNLLFNVGGVSSCTVLANDFIGVQKYGVQAVVNRSGRVLTGFRYQELEALTYADSVVWENKRYQRQQFEPVPNYILTEQWGQRGVIDSSGKELLPMLYKDISMCSNGWIVLRTESSAELVNSRLERVIKGELFAIGFLSPRYVSVTDGPYGYRRTRTYDMVVNRFVKRPPEPAKTDTPDDNYRAINYPNNPMSTNSYGSDSLVINEAGSALLKKKGFWGVRSLLGDTILPFVYDSAGMYGNQFYVSSKKKLAPLNWEGNLVYPMGLDELSWMYTTTDSLIFLKHAVYSYKGWRLRKVNPLKEKIMDHNIPFSFGIAYTDGNHILKRGFYNRQMKRLSEQPYGTFSPYNPVPMRFLAIRDSARKLITLTDSTGKQHFPWVKEPLYLLLHEQYALAVYEEGKPRLLFRFNNGSTQYDTLWIETDTKKKYDRYQNTGIVDLTPFEKRGYGKGFLTYRNAVLIKGAEQIIEDQRAVRVKVEGKWSLYDTEGKQLLAPEYDSINNTREYPDYYKRLYKNGKVGIFDLQKNKIYPPAYDSVAFGSSLYYGFFIGYTKGKANFVNAEGRIISKGWEHVKPLAYTNLDGIAAQRNGKTYLLYPSAGDSLEALPVNPSEDIGYVLTGFDGWLQVSKDNSEGVYDDIKKQWLIKPEYQNIKWVSGFFIAYKYKYTEDVITGSMTVFSTNGGRVFSLNKIYSHPVRVNHNQWHMQDGSKGDIVVNSRGKLIIPDTLEYIAPLRKKGAPLYRAATKTGKKMLIDTSGTVLIPAVDDINEAGMYEGYFTVSTGKKAGLVSPQGKQLTHCMYSGIWDVKRTARWDTYYEEYYDEPPLIEQEPFFIVSVGKKKSLKYGVLDKNGKTVVPCIYDDIPAVHNGKAVIAKLGKYWGLVTVNNKPLTAFKYDLIEMYENDKIGFERDKVTGYISDDGKEVPH